MDRPTIKPGTIKSAIAMFKEGFDPEKIDDDLITRVKEEMGTKATSTKLTTFTVLRKHVYTFDYPKTFREDVRAIAMKWPEHREELEKFATAEPENRRGVRGELAKILPTDIANEVMLVEYEHPMIKKLVIDELERMKKAGKTTANVTARLENVKTIDPDEIITKALRICEDKTSKYHAKMLAVALLTGRRTIEIAKVGTFEIVEGDDTTIMFGGQAKQKGGVKMPPYQIPVLASARMIVGKIAELRQEKNFEDSTERKVNTNIAATLGRTSAKLFACKPHAMRGMYAEICYENLGKHTNMAKTKYFGKILGHGSDDYSTSVVYQTSRIRTGKERCEDEDEHDEIEQ